jgi:hypothetical protein
MEDRQADIAASHREILEAGLDVASSFNGTTGSVAAIGARGHREAYGVEAISGGGKGLRCRFS